MVKRLVFFSLIGVLMLTALALPSAKSAPARAQDDRLSVVASFSILGDVVAMVAGDAADVDILIPVGFDPHSFAPSAQDIVILTEADVVFTNGAFFEEGLTEILEEQPEINAIVVSQCVPIWAVGAHHDEEEEGEHADEEEHAEGEEDNHADEMSEEEMSAMAALCEAHYSEMQAALGYFPEYYEETMGPLYQLTCEPHGHDEEGEEHAEEDVHEEGSCDPHFWQDPHNGILWTLFIRDTLSTLDPVNAATYAANATAYIEELSALAGETFATLQAIPQENRILITSHQTFAYLTNPLEFEVAEGVIPGGGTGSSPSLEGITELLEIIEDTGVPAIFTEPTTSDDLIDQLADETGVDVFRLYTDTLSAADGPANTYLNLIRYNATTLATALGAQ